MKKKVIFLDGDGTLWYPKTTKRTKKPHWVYHDVDTKDDVLAHIELTPGTSEALRFFHDKGIYLVVVSANPHPEEIAAQEIREKLEYFDILKYFYSYRASSGDDPNGKAGVMLQVLSDLGFGKEDALMVGDSYSYDYLAAKNIGIDAFFIENSVSEMPETPPEDMKSIKEIHELIGLLD